MFKLLLPMLTVFSMSSAFANAENPGDIIAVNGQGVVAVEPNMAYVEAAVVTEAKTVSEAQRENARIYNAAVAAIRNKFRLGTKDVQTSGYSVQPVYDTDSTGKTVQRGFSVRHSLTVLVRNLADLGSVVDFLGTAKVNQLSLIRFSHSDKRKFELEALGLAMQDAKIKAETIARSAGRAVVRLTRVENQSYDAPDATVRAAQMEKAEDVTEFIPGEIMVRATVNVQYEF